MSTAYRLPEVLRGRFDFVRVLGTGGQSDICLVRQRRRPHAHRVIKLYHIGRRPNVDVLERLRNADRDYVVQLFDYGLVEPENRWFEELEYVPDGSLDTLIADGRPLTEAQAEDFFIHLAAALSYIHERQIVHRDLKPSNLLVRNRASLQVVLADFGTASNMGGRQQHWTGAERTPEYAAPEAAFGEVSFPADWWSTGMMLAELLAGRHPMAGPTGEMPSLGEIGQRLARTPPDEWASGVPGRWFDLCRGLMRGSPGHRWGPAQVEAWLDGESPPVDEETRGPLDYRPFAFAAAGQPLWSRRDIARALSTHWAAALAVIGRNELVDWVRDELADPVLFSELTNINNAEHPADLRLFLTILALDDESPPTYQGHILTREGLAALAGEARAAALYDEAAPAVRTLQALYDHRVIGLFVDRTGSAWHREVEAFWREETRSYRLAADIVPPPARAVLAQSAPAVAAIALEAAVDREGTLQRDLAEQARRFDRGDYRDCGWFSALQARRRGPAILAALTWLEPLARDVVAQAAAERRGEAARDSVRWASQMLILAVFGLAVFSLVWFGLGHLKEQRRLDGVVQQVAFAGDRNGQGPLNSATGDPPELRGMTPKLIVTVDYASADPFRDTLTIRHRQEKGLAFETCTEPLAKTDGRILCEFKPALGRHFFWVGVNGRERKHPYVLNVRNPARGN